MIRADVTRRETITESGLLPGTPPDGGAIDTVDLSVTELSDGQRNYVTTPARRCHWNMRLEFTYADGETQALKNPSPCKRKRHR